MSKLWLNESKLSGWAYNYCRFVEDNPEVRKFIIFSTDAYNYCRLIKNRPEMKRYIKNTSLKYSRVFGENI